jgi:hypothetical protein
LLQCMSPLMAQSGHAGRANECPLLWSLRTLSGRADGMFYEVTP